MGAALEVDASDGVVVLTLNRPEKRNALSIELRWLLASSLDGLSIAETGAVVITGAGSAFCSGMDTTQFGGDEKNRRELLASSVACMRAVGECPVPVLAAVNGPALAGGFVLALARDLRVAEPDACFGFPELPRGIPSSYAWARAALPAPLARELCISGRILDADAAHREGAVAELVETGEALPRALELVTEIAARPRPPVAETKRRILLERQRTLGFLFEDEKRSFGSALGL